MLDTLREYAKFLHAAFVHITTTTAYVKANCWFIS